MLRIEVIEKYPVGGEIDFEYWANLKMEPPEAKYGYRRTMPLLDQIERPIEIPGNDKECILRFWGGEDITILKNYDDMCIELNDLEMAMLIDDGEDE